MNKPWGLEQQSAEYWEGKYWAVAKQFGELNRKLWETNQLRRQAAGLVELTHIQERSLKLSFFVCDEAEEKLARLEECWHTVGDTVYLDHSKLKDLILERKHAYERLERRKEDRGYLALSESKYI